MEIDREHSHNHAPEPEQLAVMLANSSPLRYQSVLAEVTCQLEAVPGIQASSMCLSRVDWRLSEPLKPFCCLA